MIVAGVLAEVWLDRSANCFGKEHDAMTDMSMTMGMNVQMQMKASPALIALNNMLILSTLELQQMIQQEIEDNPALELLESEEVLCQRCGRQLSGPTCISCLQEDMRMMESEREDYSLPIDDEEFDPLMLVAAPPMLSESLLRDLHASCRARTISSPIIWSAASTSRAISILRSRKSPIPCRSMSSVLSRYFISSRKSLRSASVRVMFPSVCCCSSIA